MATRPYCFRRRWTVPFLIVWSISLMLVISGCTPLRKKFTRKKKGDKEQNQKFIPVLEPIDYPDKFVSSLDRYEYHYSLWKVWARDLVQTVESNGSDKRQKYLLDQSVESLEAMRPLLTGEKQAELGRLIDDLRALEKEYDKPSSMRNMFSMKMRIERNSREIRSNFAPDPLLLSAEEGRL